MSSSKQRNCRNFHLDGTPTGLVPLLLTYKLKSQWDRRENRQRLDFVGWRVPVHGRRWSWSTVFIFFFVVGRFVQIYSHIDRLCPGGAEIARPITRGVSGPVAVSLPREEGTDLCTLVTAAAGPGSCARTVAVSSTPLEFPYFVHTFSHFSCFRRFHDHGRGKRTAPTFLGYYYATSFWIGCRHIVNSNILLREDVGIGRPDGLEASFGMEFMRLSLLVDSLSTDGAGQTPREKRFQVRRSCPKVGRRPKAVLPEQEFHEETIVPRVESDPRVFPS